MWQCVLFEKLIRTINAKSTNIFTYSLEFQKGLVPILKFHSREPSLSNFYSAKIETLPFLQYAQIKISPNWKLDHF